MTPELHDRWYRDLLGRIRRFVVGAIGRVKWQVGGHQLPDGTTETREAEPFMGIGFYARPPAGGKAEVIAVFPGGASHGCIVGFRDEATRQAMVGDLADDETAIYTSKIVIIIKADETVEIRTKSGVAQKLVPESDFAALNAWLATHVHADPVSGFTSAPVGPAVPSPIYTTVLKAE